MRNPRSSISTTTLAIIIIVIVIVAVAGGVGYYVATRKPKTVTITAPTTTTPITTITFYTWWSTTGKVAMDNLFPVFESLYHITVQPEIVPGGGGINAKFAILALVEAGKPPAAFQTHMGPEMASYVAAAPNGIKSFVNLTPIAIKEGVWTGAIEEVLLAGTLNNTMLSMPVNVHKMAVLYFNAKLLREYNLPPPVNFSDLVYDTVQLYKHGVYPWLVSGAEGGWAQLNLWEDIFLSLAVQQFGPAGAARVYNEMVYGTIDLSNATILKLINETNYWFLNFTSYDYPGWQSLSWSQGVTLMAEGKVAFMALGDFVTNYAYDFDNITTYPYIPPYSNWTNVTIYATSFPGTQDIYSINVDSVAVPAGFPTTQYGLLLVEFWASYQGQSIWTKWKATTFWANATDFFNTPEQWWNYQTLKSTPPDQFVYTLSDGGLFDDVWQKWISYLLTYQETGPSYTNIYLSDLASLMYEECQDWLAVGKMGLGYLGISGQPFAGYLPPWVIVPGYYFNSSYTCPMYSLS